MVNKAMHPTGRPAVHATDAPSLDKRIEDMEERLALERAQAVAHMREFGGKVRRRLTSPTSLIFSASIGFLTAELISARSRAVKAAQRSGKSKVQKTGGKSVLASVVKPVLPLLRIGVLGFFARGSRSSTKPIEDSGSADAMSSMLH